VEVPYFKTYELTLIVMHDSGTITVLTQQQLLVLPDEHV